MIPPQSYFLYQGPFNAEMDHTFLESLVVQKRQGLWEGSDIPADALMAARLSVNHQFGTWIGWEDVVQRNNEMRERYKTYKAVVNFKGAQPDTTNNMVNADEKIWKKMFKKMPLAKAYRYCGEPEYDNLLILYGSEDIKLEGSRGVINVSSADALSSKLEKTIILSDDEEVTSPPVKSTRRRLYDVPLESGDEHSYNDVDPRYAFVPQSYTPTFPPRNSFPFKTAGESSAQQGNQSHSSCASSSPGKFKWSPFR